MAKMSFTSANKAQDTESFPKLKLDQDESARIALFENPEVRFVHNLRAPKLINGVVQYKTVKTKDGEREEMDYDFLGNPICLGDFDVLQERGIDPKNCPACLAAQQAPDMFAAPKRRYALHVFQYNTNGTSQATKQFQGSVKVWAFTDQKFNELVDLIEEADGDPSNIDVMLGPCENKLFQKYKMVPSMKVKWKESEATKAQFEEITADNKAKDITRFIGKSVKKDWMEDDLDKVRGRWRVANGQSNEAANDGLANAERNLDAGLENLLNEDTQAKKEEPKPAASTKQENNDGPVDFDDLLNSL